MNKTELLDRAARDSEERQLLARVWDKMEQAERGTPACTGFLSTAQQEAAGRFLALAGNPRHLFSGGFADAERKVCALLPDWQTQEDWQAPYTALRCRWHPGERQPVHRDFLGAILGQGLDREKIGDILVGPDSCDILVFQELAPYLLQNFTGAGRVKLTVEEISPAEVTVPVKQVKVIRSTVSSLRLDAVMATGFSVGRGKAAELIRAGRAEVNHVPCTGNDRAVKQGDVLTCRGLGKCIIKEVGGTSRKGRILLELERYI